jgi:hypothetical protein
VSALPSLNLTPDRSVLEKLLLSGPYCQLVARPGLNSQLGPLTISGA